MELKVLKKSFGKFSDSIEIKFGNVTYDIRLHMDNMKLSVESFGIKEGRQRTYRYSSFSEDREYRTLPTPDRKEYKRNYIKENIPKQVLILAMEEFIDSIEVEEY